MHLSGTGDPARLHTVHSRTSITQNKSYNKVTYICTITITMPAWCLANEISGVYVYVDGSRGRGRSGQELGRVIGIKRGSGGTKLIASYFMYITKIVHIDSLLCCFHALYIVQYDELCSIIIGIR